VPIKEHFHLNMFADQLVGRMLSAPDGVQKAWHGIAGLQNGFLQSLGVL